MIQYQTIGDFLNNPVLSLITLILAIAGFFCSIYFYVRSKKIKKPVYDINTTCLTHKDIQAVDSIEILYFGEKIESLSISKIALWNNGKDTIDFSDVAQQNPIRILIDSEYEFLSASIIYTKNAANNFNINIAPDKKAINRLTCKTLCF